MRLGSWRFVILIGLAMSAWTSKAQLQMRSINRISDDPTVLSQTRVKAIRDTISLPFWDDFSFSSITADSTLWVENTGAIINGTLGKVVPTLNVASFDGNDLFGNPHNPDGVNSETVDVLTSQPINLETVVLDKRDSVWFSFYWQMGGLAEVPEHKDSLKVDFLDKDENWITVFEKRGVEDNLFDNFQKASIHIDQEDYFHAGFQFRFRSSGNSLGPYDTWHIDYVYLNQDRAPENESLEDDAVTAPPTPIFSEYTMIPYDLLFDFPDTIYQDISFEFSTLSNSDNPVEFVYTLANYDYPNTDSASLNSILLNISDDDDNFVVPGMGRSTNSIPALNGSYFTGYDSLFIQTELIYTSTSDGYFIRSIDGPLDPPSGRVESYLIDEGYNYRLNDTVRSYFEIHETLAYDDGTAEYAAGLNKNESQLAVYFNIPSADTLTYIDIYFPQVNPSSSGQKIVLSVLKDLSGEAISVLRSQEFVIPGGAQLNRFDRFVFDVPVIVSGEFYLALQQFTNDYIGIGLDNNSSLGTRKIFVKTEDEWSPNIKVEGMVMMRPIFADSDFVVAGVDDARNEIAVFPNPVQHELTINGNFDQFELVDLSGKSLKSGRSNKLLVSDLLNGIYFLKIKVGQALKTRKIIVQH